MKRGSKRFLSILFSLVLALGLMQVRSSTVLAEDVNLTLSLSGAQYGSYKVSVGGVDTILTTNGSTQINANPDDEITITFSPTEDGRVEIFYLEDSNYHEYHHEKDIVNNSYTFTVSDTTARIVVWFGYKNRVENVSYVDELGETYTVAATILTGAESINYYDHSYRVVLGEDNKDTWYAVKSNVSYSTELNTHLDLRGHVHLIVADGATLSVKNNIRNGSFYNVIDTLSIYGQTNHTGTVSASGVTCHILNLYSGTLAAGSVNNNTVSIKGGTLAVSGNVDAEELDISGGTTTISGTAQMVNLTLGCRSLSDSITISKYERRGTGTTKYADGQELTDGTGLYSGQIYDNTWPHGKTLRKVDRRATQTITAEDVTVTYGDTDKSVSGITDGNGAITYAVREDSVDYIDVDASTGALTIRQVPADGKAYVTVKAAGTDDYKDTTRDVTVTINKAAPTVIAPTAKTLAFTGSAQELVNAGSVTGGTMYYAVTTENTAPTDDDLYTTSIPAKTEAGTYYIWYKAKGDKNHHDSEARYVIVKIDKKMFTVTFEDGLGNTLKTEEVEGGKSAEAPAVPERDGYTFTGWDKDFSRVTEDMTVTALWEEKDTPAPTPEKTVKGLLLAKLTTRGKSKLVLSWNKIKGVQGYDIFFGKCSKKKPGKAGTFKQNKTPKRTFINLKKNKTYKAYVKAWIMKKGKKAYVAASPVVHEFTSGGSKHYTNARSIEVKKLKIILKAGKTYALKAKVKKQLKGRKLMPAKHEATLRYLSTAPKIAGVTKKGKITARKKGDCYIFVFTHNGISRKVHVIVR